MQKLSKDKNKIILAKHNPSIPLGHHPKSSSFFPPPGGEKVAESRMRGKRFDLSRPAATLPTPGEGNNVESILGERNIVLLAIETSCDETAAAVLVMANNKNWPKIETLSSVIKSQIKLHSKMGGVVPEAAARAHVRNILPVVKKALQASSFKLQEVDYIAATVGPGLVPSLIVGVEFAKGLGFAIGKPLIPINHLEGHLYSAFGRVSSKKNLFPMISLIVSGGHTILTLMKNEKEYRVLGQTVDDAAGEAFDKIAKLLKLPYPGGPEVAKLAGLGKPVIDFPRPMINHRNYNFSFAGLKTSVLYFLRDNSLTKTTPTLPSPASGGGIKGGGLKTISHKLKANVCASFQQAVVDVLITKTLRAAKEFKAKAVSLSGGVSANWLLRKTLQKECKKNNLQFFVPPINLCTDNAEMIGLAAAFMVHNGKKAVKPERVKANPGLNL